jgi:integrase
MGKRDNFTADRVAAFKCQPSRRQSIYWDGKTPGLGLRVMASGTRSYIFETWFHGKCLRTTIGDTRTWKLGQAQTEATRLKALTDQGIDPRQLKADQLANVEAVRKEFTRQNQLVSEVWSVYIEERRPKWSERHYLDHLNVANPGGSKAKLGDALIEPGALAPLMSLKLSEIDADRVKDWLKTETGRRPTQAALAFRLLRAFLNWCNDTPELKGIAALDACTARIAKDALPKKSAKTDCLQKEQLAPWFNAVRAIANPVISAYLQGLLLTGARREELAGLTWDGVDFKWNSLLIGDKIEGERTIPLTPYFASLLCALPHRNKWVFSSPAAKSGRLQEPRIQHNQAIAAAELPPLTLHGLRRSFGTLSEWLECPAGIVAQIMGHKPSATAEKHYRVRPLDMLRQWHTRIEAWMLEQAVLKSEPYNPPPTP